VAVVLFSVTSLPGRDRKVTDRGDAIAHQRETVAFLNEKAESLYPSIVWLDERSRSNVVSLSESIGVGLIHRITGRYPDLTPTIYKFDWMRQNEPEIFSKTACFADVQCYLVRCLAGGPFRTGWLSADSFGIYDIVERQWSPLLLDAIAISEDRLPSTVPPGELLGNVTNQAASETGLPEGLRRLSEPVGSLPSLKPRIK
jgi:xylulokinase